jgi:hypothetical protein
VNGLCPVVITYAEVTIVERLNKIQLCFVDHVDISIYLVREKVVENDSDDSGEDAKRCIDQSFSDTLRELRC